MPYTVTKTNLPEVLILQPKVFSDDRGFFFENFNQKDFHQATGLDVNFVQDNHSKSSQGVLRGLHYQIQHSQGKLVRVTQGSVFDVAVDLRRSSPNFGKWGVWNCLQTTSVSYGYRRALRTGLWSPASRRSFSTRRRTTGTLNMNAACCGATRLSLLSGL